ncbi:HECT domain and ankyrin repeat containing, E3 ubiquitin protein ligase 1 [Ectocarpus siliculosus]|uniref:E3 ubiquitin-protein ligase HACE1 n=1 Tax=Ectocarpus siliculosus TaxID=2880 RepID=D7FPN0_ECTSI|nr:HECT domain and ankyrin repeat containing, E3 ubiquitin protein ligase 1 [Ectocarpus siliculosus]|eukprot:CBJ30487.1 HECT domain and ankyrin repeat containing, E3 ubiquitin protein ligase 1 [Ectocarpus siliculosus]
MSSSDASDLVDSDDAEVSSPPTKSSRSRFLERSAGKGKAASRPKAASAAPCAPARNRRGIRKDYLQEEERSSSSWHGSGSDDSGGSSDEGGGGGRRGQLADGRKDTRKNPRVAASRRRATAKSGGRLDSTRSGARTEASTHRQRPPNSSSVKAPPPRRKSAVGKGPKRADSDSPYAGCDDAEDSEEEDQEFMLEEDMPAAGSRGLATLRGGNAARRRTRAISRTTGDTAHGTATRSGARKRPIRTSTAAGFPQLLESASDDDDDDQSLLSVATVKPPIKHAGSVSGDSQAGGGGGATSTLTPFALSDDDDDGCLRNTDSDDDGTAGGSGGGGGGGGGDGVSSNSSDEPVLCRCGARDWRDGTRWIRCDVPGCRTWEHLACAYPGEALEDRGGEEGREEKAHVCGGCQAKGSSTAAAGATRGGRRSLTRWGDDGPSAPSPAHSSTSLSPPVGQNTPSGSQRSPGAGSPSVRRSQRVSRLEGMRVRLRKNVVGDEESCSSSNDDPSSPRVGVVRIGGVDGDSIDHTEEDGESESDGFWAPEGQVEISQEYRCRCGATRGDDPRGGAGDGDWVQCHSDACGLWEHAACCDHGCSAPSRNATTRRHFCLDCDPKGKKHARWEDKMRKKLKRELAARQAAASGRAATATATASGVATVTGTKKTEAEKRFGAMVRGLWMAVVSGNAPLVEKAFREAEGSDVPVRRLVSAGPPEACPNVVSLLAGGRARDGGAGKGAAKDDDKAIEIEAPSASYPLPAGLSLLMVAAGYWKVIADETAATLDMSAGAASAAAATVLPDTSCSAKVSNTLPCAEDRPEKAAGAADLGGSIDPLPGTPTLPLPVDGVAGTVRSGEQELVATASNAPICKTATRPVDETTTARPGLVATTDARAEPAQTPTARSTKTAAAAATAVATCTAAASGADFPQLASDARLAVLRLVLERSRERAVLGVDAEGRTALHHAAAVGGAGEVSLLLEGELGRGAALMVSHERLTPLHVAAAAGHPETCVSILRALAPGPRAAVLEASDAGTSDETALHLACLEGRSACVRVILDEDSRVERELADEMTSHVVNGVPAETPPPHIPVVLARTAEGATALMAAAGCPSPSCVGLIIGNLRRRIIPHPRSKLSELRAVDQLGMNALHYAAGRDAEGSVSAAKAVLAAERSIACDYSAGWGEEANINAGDANNHASPLHLAAAISHKEMVTLLLTEGANSVLEDRQGWTPVMYADFGGRKEGAVLELLQHEPEKQLEALGRVLSSPGGGGGGGIDQHHHSRIVEVVQNLVTVPSFFSLVNRFIRKKPDLLLGSLSFLKDVPGLLDFENKRVLMRMLIDNHDEDTRNDYHLLAFPPMGGFGYEFDGQICIRRGAGQALGALLAWMESAARRWREEGLAAWLRVRQPAFTFDKEAGYGQGVEREGGGGEAALQGRQERDKDLKGFELLGILIGANLAWNKVLNLNLNPVVWKVMLSRKVRQSDLELVDPMYFKSLMQILETEGVGQFCLQFGDLALNSCADTAGIDPDDAVTDENKALYAKLALESKTTGRWRKQAKALAHGMRRLVPLGLLKMFTENELGLLLAGPGDIDPGDWERNAHFTGEPTAMLRRWFWNVVRSLTKEERSLLLQFATGCSRLPAGGFRGLAPRTFTVAMIDYDPERPLPMAATCFYMLKLPRYPDLYSLRKNLLVAIRHGAAGFEFS